MPKRIAIVGRSRAGKDTAGNYLSQYSKLKFCGSLSEVLCPLVAKALNLSSEEAWNTRHEHKQFWYEFANDFRKNDPLKLINMSLSKSDIVAGIRDAAEIEAARKANVFDLIIWIEKTVPYDKTLTFDSSFADIIIDNNSSYFALEMKIKNLVEFGKMMYN